MTEELKPACAIKEEEEYDGNKLKTRMFEKVTRDLGREESRDVVQSGGSLWGEESLGAEHNDERAAQFHRSQLKRQGPAWPCSAQGLGWSSVAQPNTIYSRCGSVGRETGGAPM